MEAGVLGFGVVGCGVIAPTHIKCIQGLPNARLSALCDIVRAKAEALAETAPAPIFTDYEAMLRHPDVDAVLVLTPSGLHAQVGIAAAQAGKHVLVEKPMDITLAKADALIAACRTAGIKLGCISQHRFDSAVAALKAAAESGRLGTLNFGAAHTKWFRSQAYYDSGDWRGSWAMDGGGALINQSIHYVDMLQYIMGPVAELHAYCAARAHERIEVEDIAAAVLQFKSGAIGLLEGNTAAYPGFCTRLDIYGSEGSVIIEDDRVKEWHLRSGEACSIAEDAGRSIAGTSSADISHLSHQRQLADFVDAVLSDREPKINGDEGRKPLEIVLAVYESARSGKPVRL